MLDDASSCTITFGYGGQTAVNFQLHTVELHRGMPRTRLRKNKLHSTWNSYMEVVITRMQCLLQPYTLHLHSVSCH